MPILKIGPNGDVIEGHRDMGEAGIGRLASPVLDNDVAVLSAPNDLKVLSDRQKLSNLEKKIQLDKKRKWLTNQAKSKQLEIQQKKKAEIQFLKKKKKDYLDNLRKSIDQLQVLSQSGMMHENTAGVSGYGLTPDGRRPVLSQAAVDWRPVENADYAFGGLVDEWGSHMGADQGIVTNGVAMGDELTLLKMSRVCVKFGHDGKEKEYPISVASNDTLGPITTKDQYIIENWEQNTYTVRYSYTGQEGKFYNKTLDWNSKKSLDSIWRNVSRVSADTQSKYQKQMWGWSAYFENGEFYLVKVPLIYGLPMVDALANQKTLSDWQKNHMIRDWLGYKRLSGTNFCLFIQYSPLIKAYARQFAFTHGAVGSKLKNLQYEKGTLPQTVRSGQSPTVFEKIKSVFKNAGDYEHPLIKQGLIKK